MQVCTPIRLTGGASIAIHVSIYAFIKIPTTRRPSAIDHRKRSKFVYPYVYLPHGRTRGRAHSHAGLRTRNAAAGLCILPKKMNKGGTELRSGGEGTRGPIGQERTGENSGLDTKREFKASTPATTRLITCFLPSARHGEFTSCLFKQQQRCKRLRYPFNVDWILPINRRLPLTRTARSERAAISCAKRVMSYSIDYVLADGGINRNV